MHLIREAWLIGSIDYAASETRTGHVLCALVSDESLARLASGASREFAKVLPDACAVSCRRFCRRPTRRRTPAADGGAGRRGPASGPTSTPALDQFTIDLTERARQGHIDPVLGRDAEIRQIVDILMRRRQNNPILTGEAGVGKTAVVEGFALRIAAGDVPPSLQNVSVRTLDLGLLQAGAGVKGEFENRLKSVIKEVKASPKPIILFIDEAHTLIGAGGGAGQGDAANLLKPALARGELRTIAATTWAEYKKYFEKDAALARRFQVVKVEEPDEAAGHRHDARAGRHAGTAPQGPDPERGGRRRGQAVQPLHLGPAAARQGGEPARHDLRPDRSQPHRHAAGDRGLPPADRTDRRDGRASCAVKRRWARTTRNSSTSWPPRRPGWRRSWPRRRRGGQRERELVDAITRAAGDRISTRAAVALPARRTRRRGRLLDELKSREDRAAVVAGRDAARARGRQLAGDRRNRRGVDRHSGRPDDGRPDQHRAEPEVVDGAADRRPVARARAHRRSRSAHRAPT